MKPIIEKPKFPKSLKRKDGFPKSTPWNPKLPASATSNRPPQKMWPHKDGSAVFFIDSRFDNMARSGRVKWFNPARKVDASCLVSVGNPHFNISDDTGTGSNLITSDEVFPFTKKGWKECLLKFASKYKLASEYHQEQSSEHAADAIEAIKIAAKIIKQATTV